MKKIIYTLICFLIFGFTAVNAQWTIYECNELPSLANPAWYPEGEGATPGVEDWFSVVNDPIVPGNKLLLFDELNVSGKESYAVKWEADKETGATLVWRMRASDNLLQIIQTNTDSTKVTRFAEIEVRNGWIRESVRFEYNLYTTNFYTDDDPLANRGYGLYFSQAFQKGKQNTAGNFDFDETLTDWHIYRMTIQGSTVKVYIDENPTPAIVGDSPTLARHSWARIGDKQPEAYMGTLYDWIIWDVSGAYPPKQGTPIPMHLIGWQTDVEENETAIPDDFTLYPNFPNPFNPETTIQFDLVKSGNVNLHIYDIKGQTIRTLLNEYKQAGTYQVHWDGRDETGQLSASGLYI